LLNHPPIWKLNKKVYTANMKLRHENDTESVPFTSQPHSHFVRPITSDFQKSPCKMYPHQNSRLILWPPNRTTVQSIVTSSFVILEKLVVWIHTKLFILSCNLGDLSCKPSTFRKRVRKVTNNAKLMGGSSKWSERKWSEAKWIMVQWREGLMTIPTSWLLLFSYSMIIIINTTLHNCSCDCCIFILCRVFIVCVVLCAVFRLIVVLFCVMCIVCVLCLIVVPLPPGENPFAVKINNNNNNNFRQTQKYTN
jgi:hypothetical protein